MQTTFRKFVLGALIALIATASLALAATPLSNAYAAAPAQTGNPPAGTPAPGSARRSPAAQAFRIELAFAREQYNLQRVSLQISNSAELFKQTQELIDKAKTEGKDVSAVQTAFDAFKLDFEKSKVPYEQAKTIAAAHAGFDASGKVTELEQARTTVKDLSEALKQHREALGDSFKALREAIRAFRQANPRPTATPSS